MNLTNHLKSCIGENYEAQFDHVKKATANGGSCLPSLLILVTKSWRCLNELKYLLRKLSFYICLLIVHLFETCFIEGIAKVFLPL